MKKIGLTGGIGSGKSRISEEFRGLGIAVYDSDSKAKTLMNNDLDLISALKAEFSDEVYTLDGLNREFLAKKVFSDKNCLKKLNSLVHPAVLNDFLKWSEEQNSDYVVLESAILVESGFYATMDLNINVVAPLEQRVARVIRRDSTTQEQVISRIKAQISDAERTKHCDFEINNPDGEDITQLVTKIDHEIRS